MSVFVETTSFTSKPSTRIQKGQTHINNASNNSRIDKGRKCIWQPTIVFYVTENLIQLFDEIFISTFDVIICNVKNNIMLNIQTSHMILKKERENKNIKSVLNFFFSVFKLYNFFLLWI